MRTRSVVGAAVAAFVLAACGAAASGSSSPSPSPSPAASAATSTAPAGMPFNAKDFTTVLPDGWEENSHDCGGTPLEMCIIATRSSGSTVAIIQVITWPPPKSDADLPSALKALVDNNGAQNDQTGTATVGDTQGPSVTYTTNNSGSAATSNEDVAVNHSNTTFEISLVVIQGGDFSKYSDDFNTVLSQWKWTSS